MQTGPRLDRLVIGQAFPTGPFLHGLRALPGPLASAPPASDSPIPMRANPSGTLSLEATAEASPDYDHERV